MLFCKKLFQISSNKSIISRFCAYTSFGVLLLWFIFQFLILGSNKQKNLFNVPDCGGSIVGQKILGVSNAKSARHEIGGWKVPVEVRSGKNGLGVFTVQGIKRGTVVWEFDQNGVGIEIRGIRKLVQYLSRLSPKDAAFFVIHAYWNDDDLIRLGNDMSDFLNHSQHPNLGDVVDQNDIYWNATDKNFALQNISAGEELTMDYAESFVNDGPDWFYDHITAILELPLKIKHRFSFLKTVRDDTYYYDSDSEDSM